MKLSDSDFSEENKHQQYCWFPPAESWQIYPPVCVHIKEFNAAKKIVILIMDKNSICIESSDY